MAELPFPEYRYCIDTSALIDLKRLYPSDVPPFRILRDNMGGLVLQKRLIAPR